MYFKIILQLLLLLATLSGISQQITLNWALAIEKDDYARFISATDDHGSTFLAGSYSGNKDFDPGPSVVTLTGRGIFVMKLDVSGKFLWVKPMPGTGTINDMVVDHQGNVCLTGYYRDSIDIDPGPGNLQLKSTGGANLYIEKLTTNGELNWVKTIPLNFPGREIPVLFTSLTSRIAADRENNLYITDVFYGDVDFDPGEGNFVLEGYNASFVYTDIFILKLDQSGIFKWVKKIETHLPFNVNYVNALTVDSAGHLYTAGIVNGTIDFDPGPQDLTLPTCGTCRDVFIQRFDKEGNLLWAKSLKGTGSTNIASIKTDRSGNLYLAGNFGGIVDFDTGPGSFCIESTTSGRAFLEKLDTSGNMVWIRNEKTGFYSVGPLSMDIDPAGNIYTSGTIESNGAVNGPDGAVLPSGIVIQKHDANGGFIWLRTIATKEYYDRAWYIDAGRPGNVLLTGYLKRSCDLDPGPAVAEIINKANSTIFVCSWNEKSNPLGLKSKK